MTGQHLSMNMKGNPARWPGGRVLPLGTKNSRPMVPRVMASGTSVSPKGLQKVMEGSVIPNSTPWFLDPPSLLVEGTASFCSGG